MPVSKTKPKFPRVYFSNLRKMCSLSRSELAQKLNVSASMIDRYENGSCDFQSNKLTVLFSDLSELCGVPVSEIIRYESDYQNRAIEYQNKLGSQKSDFPSITSQKQLNSILIITSKISLSELPDKMRRFAEARLLYPTWSIKQIAEHLELNITQVYQYIFKINKLAQQIAKENDECQ